MADNITAALEALKREFDSTHAFGADLADETLIVHIDAREAFHGKPWRVEWSINSGYFEALRELRCDDGEYVYTCDAETMVVAPREAKRILETTGAVVEAPAGILHYGTVDPDTMRMLRFALSLDYLTVSGKSVLPIRLVWDL